MGRGGFCFLEGVREMSWDRIVERLSVPGLVILAVGVAMVTQAAKICRLVFKEKGEKAVMPAKIVGLALTVLAVVILLDFIPGL